MYLYTNIHARAHTHTHTNIHARACTHTRAHTNIHARTHTQTYTHARTRRHTHMRSSNIIMINVNIYSHSYFVVMMSSWLLAFIIVLNPLYNRLMGIRT